MEHSESIGRDVRAGAWNRLLAAVHRHAIVGLALFIVVFAVFRASPVRQVTDSKYSMLLSETILRRRSVDLKYAHLEPGDRASSVRDGYPYQTILVHGRLLYYLGWGGSVLALPAVAALNAAGISTVGPGGRYERFGEFQIQSLLAALLSAAAIWVIFRTALLAGLPTSWAVAISLGTALGTQVWSTASRALWSQTWLLLLSSIAIWLLLRWELERGEFRPALTATLLSWMYFVRPASNTIIILISAYVFLTYPKRFPVYLAIGLAWLGGFVGLSLHFYGAALPPYYRELWWLSTAEMRHRLAGLLFSPSRGLLIYSPVVLFVLYLVARYRTGLGHKRLAVLALAVIGTDLILLSTLTLWWGGWSYGPRELTDTIPWFALLAIVGGKAFLDDPTATLHSCATVIAAGMVLLMISVVMNAPGALSPATFDWNAWADVERHQERLWDWSHAQFLAAMTVAPLSDWVPEQFNGLRPAKAMRDSLAELAVNRSRPQRPFTGEGPEIDSVNGIPVIAGFGKKGEGWAPTVLLPNNHNALVSWWDADTAEPVVLQGHGFDTRNGVGVSVFCDCPGSGQVGPFFRSPGDIDLDETRILIKLPRSGANSPPVGPALLVVYNAGTDGTYSQASRGVWVSIGAPIGVTHVRQSGARITVQGSGFSNRTVVSLYAGNPPIRFGAMDAAGRPRIPLRLTNDSRLAFQVPANAKPGPAYVETLNPPFLPFSSSLGDPGGAFVLQ